MTKPTKTAFGPLDVFSKPHKSLTVAEIVDRIGALKAAMAPLDRELEQLSENLKARGAGRYEGTRYDATVSAYSQFRLNMAAAKAKLSAQFIRANTDEIPCIKLEVRAKLPALITA